MTGFPTLNNRLSGVAADSEFCSVWKPRRWHCLIESSWTIRLIHIIHMKNRNLILWAPWLLQGC